MTVRVAIDLALDRLFTYEVPAALQGKLAVGQLLSVPFGHREARGFAMSVGEGEDAAVVAGDSPRVLRPVTAIVDETPFFTPVLLALVRRMAAYTAAPLESVLKAALPAAVLRRNARAREQLFVEPVPGAAAEGLTARQKWLFDQLVRLGGGWLNALCAELKTTPATLRQLATRGIVALAPRTRRRDPLSRRRLLPTKPLPLNAEQEAALAAILGATRPVLLFGVTGSGKTEVYLQAIAKELEAGRGAIVMVPEISLTPQTVERFASRFGGCVAVLHSALSDGERYDEWHRIRSGEARVVIGPRSAVWAPVVRLGLIVVDEEHEASYKQDESPRYHARDVAVLRGALEGAKVVLGSATPSLESWMNAKRGKYALATIAVRAGAGTLPVVRLVERGVGEDGGAIFSRELLEALRLRLDRGEQSILFLNRRGFSRAAACAVCGTAVECPACGLPYTYHRTDACLRCHVCGGWAPLPAACPACGGALDYRGVGTERAEAALAKCLPRARILRMDADSTSRKNSHDDLLSTFRRGEADVLLGTQMIAKGLDFPNVTLVGVLNADAALNLPDFRASERAYQLLAQVAGRAGRAALPGEVLIQSHDVESPVLDAVLRGDFARFAADELKGREACFLPPFSHVAVLLVRAREARLAGDWAGMYAASLAAYARKVLPAGGRAGRFEVAEAMPCALEKADGWYRWQVVVRAASAGAVSRAWRWLAAARPAPRELRVSVDIDAFNLI